jgi:hypothetical protein
MPSLAHAPPYPTCQAVWRWPWQVGNIKSQVASIQDDWEISELNGYLKGEIIDLFCGDLPDVVTAEVSTVQSRCTGGHVLEWTARRAGSLSRWHNHEGSVCFGHDRYDTRTEWHHQAFGLNLVQSVQIVLQSHPSNFRISCTVLSTSATHTFPQHWSPECKYKKCNATTGVPTEGRDFLQSALQNLITPGGWARHWNQSHGFP